MRFAGCWAAHTASAPPVTPTTCRNHPEPGGQAQTSPAGPAQQAASQLRVQRLPITWTLQMAQVSHSTSQLHMATAFHFLRENILSPPDLEPALPECEDRTQGSSPSSTSAMAAAQNGDADVGRGVGSYGGSAGSQHKPQGFLQARPRSLSEEELIGWCGPVTSLGLGEACSGNPGA